MTAQILVVSTVDVAALFPDSMLSRRNPLIASVRTAGEALRMIRESVPQLVIFDFDLGEMDAPEFCRRVRTNDDLRHTSLLFIAKSGMDTSEVDLCMAAGCNDILLRPFCPDELDRKVQKLVAVPHRRELRTLTKVEVSSERSGHFVLGHSVNISSSGMLLELDHVLPPEAQVRLQFYLHGERAPLCPIASVVRADFSGGFPRYGMKFDEIDEPSRDRIARFVVRMKSREAL